MSHHNGGRKVDDEIFEEYAIPRELRALHRSLRCQMCGGLFDKAVTIQDCGHTFCSVCIRSFFQSTLTGVHRQVKQCPSCRHEIVGDVDRALTLNRTVQEAVTCFKNLLVTMHESGQSTLLVGGGDGASTSSRGRSSSRETGGGTGNEKSSASSRQIKGHADRDDTADGAIEIGAADTRIDTKLPRLNFSTMKKKQLLDLCRKRGLPSNGTEEELKELHRRYVVKHNAELDNTNGPRTPAEVVTELMNEVRAQKEEQMRATFNGSKQHAQLIKTLHASGGVSSGNAKFDEALQGNFKTLIKQARERKEKDKKKTADERSPDEKDGNGSDGGTFEFVGVEDTQRHPGFASSTPDVPEKDFEANGNATTNNNDKENDSLSSGSYGSTSVVANMIPSSNSSASQVVQTSLDVSISVATKHHATVATHHSNTTSNAALPWATSSRGTVEPNRDRKRPSPTSLTSSSSSLPWGRKVQRPIDVDNADAPGSQSNLHRSLRNRKWACQSCTYENLSMDTKCAICNTPKG